MTTHPPDGRGWRRRQEVRSLVWVAFALVLPTGVGFAQVPANRNPAFNASLNPKFNAQLNPVVNPALSPTRPGWSGVFVFNTKAEHVGVLARAASGVLNAFSPSGRWIGYAVSDSNGGYNLFDLEAAWKGYLRSNEAGGFNEFEPDGEWIGFTT